ncbi:hypothetical protein [Corynebacterium glyciniphilum]|uniref:hypothetical protein n=1 Tax=Corynebacterium glyciniphilum TaxID=1404244 RepID=UPI0011AB457A|nr:hypothetical protein [Corynebacterium glyciniphilum]
MTDTPTLIDYNGLAHRGESHADRDTLAAALNQPTTPVDRTLANEHDAVLCRALPDHQDDPETGMAITNAQQFPPTRVRPHLTISRI